MNMPHPRLTGSPDSVRLLKLLPGFPGQPISCTTYTVNLADNPKYFALSYMWGAVHPTYYIFLNARPFHVRENLWQLLRRIRSEDHSLVLWCDQLCIDQEDEEDKSQQVRNMGKIYETAEETWVWLGDLDPNMENTMRFVSRVAKVYDQAAFDMTVLNNMNPGHWWSTNRNSHGDKSAIFAQELELLLNSTNARVYDRDTIADALRSSHVFALEKIARDISGLYEDLEASEPVAALRVHPFRVHNLIQELGSRKYWQRARIIQELLLSRKIAIYAGSVSMPFWIFQDLTTHQVSSVRALRMDRNSYNYSKADHITDLTWPLSKIATMIRRYYPSWNSPLSYRCLLKVEELFDHEKWPRSQHYRGQISVASGLTKLKTDIGRSGATGSTILTIQDCLKLVVGAQCFDWRDKIFSVLAITTEHSEGSLFPIDYSCTKEKLFFDTMRFAFLERLLIIRASAIALALSMNLKNFIEGVKPSGIPREASSISNDGISVVSWGPHGFIHRIHPRETIQIFTLDVRFEFGSPESLEVLVNMHNPEHKLGPGFCVFRASRTCYAVLESNRNGAAVIGWALLLGHDLPPFDLETMANLRLHDGHGRSKVYAEKHLCLNEKQVLVLLSTEINTVND